MPKILIIEDRRENIVFIVNNILKPKGHDVITAMDGRTGLEKAEREAPDLIITDLKLPKMNGLDILEKLREKGNWTPAIVMTFHGTEETAVRALRLGARDYLIKPFTFEEMEAALERAFQASPAASGDMEALKAQAKIKSLEEQLAKMKEIVRQREQAMAQLSQADDSNGAGEGEDLAKWEQDNLRLNRMLAQAKVAYTRTESRASALEEALAAQKSQTAKYQKEARRLANELRNLSEAMRLMAQDMEQQMGRTVTGLLPRR
jgi:DNA-binding response OmpR family regulator